MIKRHCAILLGILLCTACSKKEEVFYSTTYPITQIEVRCTLEGADEGDDAATPSLRDQLIDAVLTTAPVQAGGSYRIDFNRYDGGKLTVRPTEGASRIEGSFTKVPAASEMTFTYGEQHYKVRKIGYNDDEGVLRISFEVDLTEEYKAQYGIENSNFKLIRVEKSAHLYE